jgi:hypothetical protein
VKYDGYRIMLIREQGRVRLISRGGYDLTRHFPLIVEQVHGVACKRKYLAQCGRLSPNRLFVSELLTRTCSNASADEHAVDYPTACSSLKGTNKYVTRQVTRVGTVLPYRRLSDCHETKSARALRRRSL